VLGSKKPLDSGPASGILQLQDKFPSKERFMRVSALFGETLREAPADVDTVSHQLLLRAGYVRQLAAGIFSYLPLAQRSLKKIEQILREEMDAIGGQELSMPVVHPSELWQQSGRWTAIDETMVRFKDRKGRDMLLAMTHEEVVAALAASEVRSYRLLPQMVYQLQTKFRDEARPRGGLIRLREFVMKDSYSLDRDEAGLQQQYISHYNAYFRIGARAGLPLIAVGSDVGMMGGKVAHEFMYLTPIGEDTLVLCPGCGYSANHEVARFAKEPFDGGAPARIEKVHTPGKQSISDLAAFLGVDPRQTLKMVFFVASYGPDKPTRLVAAAVRGDMEVNQTAVTNLTRANAARPAHPEEIQAAGLVPGYASPVGLKADKALVVIDDVIDKAANLVAGANEVDHHLRNVCPRRDFPVDLVGHIALAREGVPCARCGAPLKLARGVEVGNIFQLGTRYSVPLEALFNDEDGQRKPIVMGSYGIGVDRMLACVAEEHRDDYGLALPISVAPYEVNLVSLARQEATRSAAEKLYADLQAAGIEVLYDDREATPGVKFAEADLRGMPLRLTVSDRSLSKGGVELKRRRIKEFTSVPLDQAVEATKAQIQLLKEELLEGARKAPVWQREGT
jgi:prolyl-tRNA synthetase